MRVDLKLDFDERVNAVYHLACLGGSISCTKDVFERLWRERLTWTDADQAALDMWKQIMSEVSDAAPARAPAPFLPNTFRFHPSQSARIAVIVAAVEAASAQGLRRKSHDILNAGNAVRLKSAIDHFERRIRTWFRSIATRSAKRRIAQISQKARRSHFSETAVQMARFLEADLPNSRVYMHAIAAPEPQSTDFTATVFGNHFVIEVVDSLTDEEIVSAAIHEVTHYIYDRAPEEQHLALIRQFVESKAPSAAGLYTYLNEAVAISAHALLAEKRHAPPEDGGTYAHPYIAPLGTVTATLVKDAIANHTTLFDGLVADYIARGTEALKEKLHQPQFVLAQVGLLLPEDGDALRTAYMEKMFPQASALFRSEGELDEFPHLNVVRFSRYDAMGDLGANIPGFSALTSHRGFAYAMPRRGDARVYLLAGRDDDAILDLIGTLADMEALASEGLLFSLD